MFNLRDFLCEISSFRDSDFSLFPQKAVARARLTPSSKILCALIGLGVTLSGCSSMPLFRTSTQSKMQGKSYSSNALSDIEAEHMGRNDSVRVSSLSPSIVDRNIANSTRPRQTEKETTVDLHESQPKTEHAAVRVDPPKPSAAPRSASVPTSRTALTGKWSIREAGSAGCKVMLSGSPSLDLYKASTSGCNGSDMRSVNRWDVRNGEVYLYSRGNVVARFKGNGSALQGALSKSGAPLVLSR
jgi:hypothetical protein